VFEGAGTHDSYLDFGGLLPRKDRKGREGRKGKEREEK